MATTQAVIVEPRAIHGRRDVVVVIDPRQASRRQFVHDLVAVDFGTLRPQTSAGAITSEWLARDAGQRESRQHHHAAGIALLDGHDAIRDEKFDEVVREGLTMSVEKLVSGLATDFGLPWVDLAELVGVSVPAIRKWRMGRGTTPENARSVAQVRAFLTMVRSVAAIAEPVSWLNRRLVEGYTVTPKHLYSRQSVIKLLDNACGGLKTEQMLDDIAPGWRDTYRSDYEVVRIGPGETAVVRRT